MKLAIFDFDGTLFPQDTLPFLLRQWHMEKRSLKRLLSVCVSVGALYIRYKLGASHTISREMMRRTALQYFTRIFAGMNKSQVSDFLKHNARLIVPLLRPSVVDELHRAQRSGYHTVLLSGGYEKLMEYVGAALGIDTVIGTALHYKNGTVDTRRALDIVCGDGKAERLKAAFADKQVDWAESAAYADSYSDLPILRMVGHPVAVRPDRDLAALLPELGWHVI